MQNNGRRDDISRILNLNDGTTNAELERVLKALDSLNRIRILRFLSDRVASVSEIAASLDIPTSTAALHIETLEEAGLIRSEMAPASRGVQKVCARMYDKVILDLPVVDAPREQLVEVTMPIGAFVDCQVSPTCGLLSETGIIGLLDDPASFYEPTRLAAQLLWFQQGYVEYRFPNRIPSNTLPEALRLSMEICSEAPLFNLDWPSDITVWINGVEIGTWTSPADFGGEPGRLTPEWWTSRNTQYGLLKFWHVSEHLSEVDGMQISTVSLADLKLLESPFISVRIGIKPDAEHVGGLNLFGSKFGNYPQDLVLSVAYRPAN
ncbi:MAG TPA: helix-turn-helix domain-containing protein [Chloroflexia bacterium]|nr:helix-turn-helix domain-containing protein [Chloroflexia bacterium]